MCVPVFFVKSMNYAWKKTSRGKKRGEGKGSLRGQPVGEEKGGGEVFAGFSGAPLFLPEGFPLSTVRKQIIFKV